MQRTIPQLFEDSVKQYPNNALIWEKSSDTYTSLTYAHVHALVCKFANGLLSLGLNKGDRVALISEGRSEWAVAELGILYCGAINVPISIKLDETADLKFRLSHAECRFAVVSESQKSKIDAIKPDLPNLEIVIVLDQLTGKLDDEYALDDLYRLGTAFSGNNPLELTKRWQSVKESDYANICYTSGTTADPKGIILSHRNYTANVEQSTSLLPIPQQYVSLLILPWDHAFAHTVGLYTLMKNGASFACVKVGKTPLETLKNIPVNIRETKPTFLLSVPALAKNFRKSIERGIAEKGPVAEKLFKTALANAYAYNGSGYDRGKGVRRLRYPLLRFFDKILFSKIRENFGGRLEFFIGGGALLDIELQRFFYAIGIPMLQGYGLTEASPVISSNVPVCHKLGSSGKKVADMELKICDEKGRELPAGEKGEIVIKGENVMVGYWRNEKATNETIKDGWLFTGDLGYLDNDGFLYVLGRSKSLLISNDGEKYSPEGIEEAIVESSPYIDQLMLYNNQSPYTVALLVPNKENLLRYAKEHTLVLREKSGQEAILKLLQSEIDKFKTAGVFGDQFPQRWLPAAVAVLGEGFTEQNHFLNSTLKMVRGKIAEFYKPRLDYLFTAEAKDICNHQNTTIISRF